MKARTIVTIVLLLFVSVSAGYLAVKELSRGSEAASVGGDPPPTVASANEPAAVGEGSGVVVYYFHGTVRCPTCRKFESYCDELIREDFSEQVGNGRLEWRIVNVDEPQNKHFVDDYQLYTKSIVVVKRAPGGQAEWKNLEKIWQLVGDKQAFVKYVRDEITSYLGSD